MDVGELIKELQKVPKNYEVRIGADYGVSSSVRVSHYNKICIIDE